MRTVYTTTSHKDVVNDNTFSTADYSIFGITVAISLGIGVYHALSGGKQRTISEYLVGDRKVKILPVAISLMVTFESSLMMLGMPAEVYIYGMQLLIGSIGYNLSQLLAVWLMVPLIHPLKLTSAYEYLELRFKSRLVRSVGSFLGIISAVWYSGVVLFGPAIALEAVTGFDQWNSIFLVATAAVIYTSIGGLKAVIWTDVFQAAVMFAGMFAVLIKKNLLQIRCSRYNCRKPVVDFCTNDLGPVPQSDLSAKMIGTLDVGGTTEVFRRARRGGRVNLFNFDVDPTVRHTFWNLLIGRAMHGLTLVFNQSTVQRISATHTLKGAKIVMLLVCPAFLVTGILAIMEGVVAYSYYDYHQCDPLQSQQISNPNQIIPYMVIDIFNGLPGMPGLYLASLVSASLSTISSALSGISALVWKDFVEPLFPNHSEHWNTIVAKLSVVVFGLISCGVAVIVSHVGGPMTQISASFTSAFGGPLAGLFLAGALCPSTNRQLEWRCVSPVKRLMSQSVCCAVPIPHRNVSQPQRSGKRNTWLLEDFKGAILGAIISFGLTLWISMGATFSPHIHPTPWLPPTSTQRCPHNGNNSFVNYTSTGDSIHTTTMSVKMADSEPQGIEKMYLLSYLWFHTVAVLTVIIVAVVVGHVTGSKADRPETKYVVPLWDNCCCLPRSVRNLFSYGPLKDEQEEPISYDKAMTNVKLSVFVEHKDNATSVFRTEENKDEDESETSIPGDATHLE